MFIVDHEQFMAMFIRYTPGTFGNQEGVCQGASAGLISEDSQKAKRESLRKSYEILSKQRSDMFGKLVPVL